MVLALHGVASAADAPQPAKDATKITKGPAQPPAAPVPGRYQFGDFNLAVSGVATIGTGVRTTGRNAILLYPPNGALLHIPATARGGAGNGDGNLNWNSGEPVSSVAKAFVTIDANYKEKIGVFARVKGWYDYTLATQGVPWGNFSGGYLSGAPLGQVGWDSRARSSGLAVQEAYGYAKGKAGDATFEARAGDILVPWGLPTMIPGGLSFAVNAVDYAAVNRPGVQPEEIFIPTPGVWARLGLFDNAAIEAFSLFTNPKSVLAGCGTFFSGSDSFPSGCNYVSVGPFSSPGNVINGTVFNRAPTPSNHDAQFGVGASYVADPIGTKFGLYYSHVDNPTPLVAGINSLNAAPPWFTPFAPTNPRYFINFAEGVDSFALNFTTQKAGTTLYGEYVYKPNAPVSLNSADVVAAMMSPVSLSPLHPYINAAGPGGVVNVWDRLQVGNLVFGGRQVLPGVLGAKAVVLGAEFGAKSVYNLPDPSERRYGRADIFGPGPVNGVCPVGAPAYQCTFDGYITSLAWGYRLTSSYQYENVFKPGVNVTPTIGLSHDVSGYAYDGVMSQGRVLLNLKVRVEYQKKYFFDVAWNPALRTGFYDPMSDRQIVSLAAGMKF